MLSWKELQEVLLDVEIVLNNRPLSYLEDDPQLPVLTPSSMLFVNSEAMWRRWSKEYLHSLCEKHRAQATAQGKTPAIGDAVIVQTEERNRGKWPLGIVENYSWYRWSSIRGAVLRSGKSRMERVVQHLYPIELS